MSLSAGQRRALGQIEKALADDDLRLGLLFSAFTRLAVHEAMPVTEPIPARPRRRMRSAVMTVIGLAIVTIAFILSQALPSRQASPDTIVVVSAHMRIVPGDGETTVRSGKGFLKIFPPNDWRVTSIGR